MAKQKDELAATQMTLVPAELAELLGNSDPSAGIDLTPEEMKLPFWTIIQDMSNKHKEAHPDYVPGAKTGMLIDSSVTNRLAESLDVVLVATITGWSEFKPNQGGFVGFHDVDSDIVKQATDEIDQNTRQPMFNKKVRSNGNKLVKGKKIFLLVLDENGKPQPGFFSGSGLADRELTDFLSKIVLSGQHLIAKKYTLSTKAITNKQNTLTYIPVFTDAGFNTPEIVKYALEAQTRFDSKRLNASLNALQNVDDAGGSKSTVVDISDHQK